MDSQNARADETLKIFLLTEILNCKKIALRANFIRNPDQFWWYLVESPLKIRWKTTRDITGHLVSYLLATEPLPLHLLPRPLPLPLQPCPISNSSSNSFQKPVAAITFTGGAWFKSTLMYLTHLASDISILTHSLTCFTRKLNDLPTTYMLNSAIPPQWTHKKCF